MQVVLPHRLSQTDLPGKGPCVGDLLPVEGDESALLRPIEVRVIVHADYGDLVVGEQVAFNRLAERESVEDISELGGVVHRGNLKVGVLRRLQHPTREVARCRRHE